MDGRAGELWQAYREKVVQLYETSEAWTQPQGLDAEGLDEVIELSDRIDQVCSEAMREGDYDEAPTALLASAAVDANMAAAVLVLATTYEASGDLEAEDEARTLEVEEGQPSPEERPSLWEMLAEGDEAFGAAAIGGAEAAEDGNRRAQMAIDELLTRATPVACGFALGVVTLGGGELASVLIAHVEPLRELARGARKLFDRGVMLVDRAFRKLIKALGGPGAAAAALGGGALNEFVEVLRKRVEGVQLDAVRKVTRAAVAEQKLGAIAERLGDLDQASLRSFSAQLDELCSSFRKRMKLAGWVRGGLRRAGAPLAIGSGGPGVAAVAAMNAAGVGCVLYSLAVRLDTAPALTQPGVPTLALEAIGAQP